MSSETALLRDYKSDRPAPKWCVYYDDENGDVVTVTNRAKDQIKSPYIVTDSDDARKILMGHVDPKKFAVVDVNHELKLVEKSAVLRIKEAERRLSVVPLNNKTKADINIILYINSWKMEVNFNQDTLYRMTGKRFFRNISLNPEQDGIYDPITLFLIKDNDPNFLVKTIEIDPGELIEEGYLIFDMAPLRRICGLGEMSVMTKKIFSSYRLQRKANFTGIDYRTRYSKRRSFAKPSEVTEDISTDFTIIRNGDTTRIKSNFQNPQDSKIYTDIGLYITDPLNPSQLLDHIVLPLGSIGWDRTLEISTPGIDLTKCGILCRESNVDLTFDYINQPE